MSKGGVYLVMPNTTCSAYPTKSGRAEIIQDNETQRDASQIGLLFLFLGLCYSIWPVTSDWLSKQQQNSVITQNFTGIENSGWKKVKDPNWKWQADFKDVENETISYYAKNDSMIEIYQANFGYETQGGGELVNSQNLLLSAGDQHWKIVNTGNAKIMNGEENQLMVDETVMRGANHDLLALRWYRIGKYNTSNNYLAKWLQLTKRLMADSSPEYIIVTLIAAPKNRHEFAREKLINAIKLWLATDK